MFNNDRYVTCEMNRRVPYSIQLTLWNIVDSMSVKKDYLQVFEIKSIDKGVNIIHRQEVPFYTKEYFLKIDWIGEEKIFIIDDNTHSTMLLAEDY